MNFATNLRYFSESSKLKSKKEATSLMIGFSSVGTGDLANDMFFFFAQMVICVQLIMCSIVKNM